MNNFSNIARKCFADKDIVPILEQKLEVNESAHSLVKPEIIHERFEQFKKDFIYYGSRFIQHDDILDGLKRYKGVRDNIEVIVIKSNGHRASACDFFTGCFVLSLIKLLENANNQFYITKRSFTGGFEGNFVLNKTHIADKIVLQIRDPMMLLLAKAAIPFIYKALNHECDNVPVLGDFSTSGIGLNGAFEYTIAKSTLTNLSNSEISSLSNKLPDFNMISLQQVREYENIKSNTILQACKLCMLEVINFMNEFSENSVVVPVTFSRIARKHFADEQPEKAEKAEQPEQSAEKKSEPAKDELLELLKHVQEHGLKEKMSNQQFFDANKKLFMDKFLMNGEKKRTPQEFMDAVREYGKKNGLEGVVHWILDGKTDKLKSGKVAEESLAKTNDKQSSQKSEQSKGEQNTEQSIKDDPSNPSYYTEVPVQNSQPDKATNARAKKKISKKDLYDLVETIGKIEWKNKSDTFIKETFPDAAGIFELEDIRSFLETAQEFVEAGKTIGSVADFVGRIFRLTPFNPLNLIRLAKVLWKGVESTPDVFWNEGTSQLFEG